MIDTENLSQRQKVLFDIIWNIEEWDQVEIFVKSLSKRDRIDCLGLIELIKLSIVDEYSQEKDFKEAKELINRVK
jgi:hypothetical protein